MNVLSMYDVSVHCATYSCAVVVWKSRSPRWLSTCIYMCERLHIIIMLLFFKNMLFFFSGGCGEMAFEKVRGEKNVTEVVYCEEHKGRNNHKERRSRKMERLVESRSLLFLPCGALREVVG